MVNLGLRTRRAECVVPVNNPLKPDPDRNIDDYESPRVISASEDMSQSCIADNANTRSQ
jgi:hypothetical protein